MKLNNLQQDWEAFAQKDPLWAVLTDPTKIGRQWEEDAFFKTGSDEITSLLATIKKEHIHLNLDQALDFGCGTGRLTQGLAKYFKKVIGLDLAPTMIAEAQKLNQHRSCVKYVLNPNPDLRIFSSPKFDLIYSSLTLQHIAPRYTRAYLKEFCRVLQPDGVLAVRIPGKRIEAVADRINLLAKIKWTIRKNIPNSLIQASGSLIAHFRHEPRMELYGLSPRAVKLLLEKRGMKNIKIISDPIFSPGETWTNFLYCATKADDHKSNR